MDSVPHSKPAAVRSDRTLTRVKADPEDLPLKKYDLRPRLLRLLKDDAFSSALRLLHKKIECWSVEVWGHESKLVSMNRIGLIDHAHRSSVNQDIIASLQAGKAAAELAAAKANDTALSPLPKQQAIVSLGVV